MTVTAIRRPRTTLNLIPRDQILGVDEHRVVVVGQKLASGSAAAGLVQDVPRTLAEIEALFGVGSHLSMILRKFRDVNKYSRVDVIALADASGTKGTSIVTVAGTATAAKRIYVDVVSSEYHSYEIDVEVDDEPADITAKIVAKLALDLHAPFTAVVSTVTITDNTMTFTARNFGTLSNAWMIRVRDAYNKPASVAGLTFTLTGWTGGATDPTLTSVLNPLENVRVHSLIWPQAYSTAVPKAWINARFNLDNDIKDGVAFSWVHDTYSNVKALSLAMNSASWVMMTNETMNTSYWKGPHIPEAPDVIVAAFVGARSRRYETNISVSDIVVNNESRDQFGGIHMCTLPYFNTKLLNVEQPEEGSGYTYPEQDDLEDSGLTIISGNDDNNAVIMGDVVTTYRNDAAGNTDDTWHWLNWRDSHSIIRETLVNNLRATFAQHRLSTGASVANFAIATEPSIRAEIYKIYDFLADNVITVRGRDAHKILEDRLTIEIVPESRLVRLSIDTPMVSQLGSITGTVKFSFGV